MKLFKILRSIRNLNYTGKILSSAFPGITCYLRIKRASRKMREWLSPKSCFPINDKNVIIGVNFPNEISFSGIINIKVIRGAIEILGYQITPKCPPTTVYSTKEYCTLKIRCIADETQHGQNTIYLKSQNFEAKKVEDILSDCSTFSHLYLVTRNEVLEDELHFLKTYEYPLFVKENLEDSFFKSSSEFENDVIEDEKWEDLAKEFLARSRKVVITGGSKSGKSTLLCYLVNRCLSKWPEVLVLDLDPGQNGFSVMGCLNAIIVNRPLLVPNFAQSLTPVRSLFLGDVSVMSCYHLYSQCVRNLVNFCNRPEYKNLPWFVNTMGFTKGVGIKLLGVIVNEVKPTDIIQLESNKPNSNFSEAVTPDFLKKNTQRECFGGFNLHIVSSYTKAKKSGNTTVSLEPSTRRNLVVMSYFKKAISSGNNLLSADFRRLKISHVKIMVQKPSSRELEMSMSVQQKLCCINGNLVALCRQDPLEKLTHCHGFGIVRGFDEYTDHIYVITPMKQRDLDEIKIIQMSSSIRLPQKIYTSQIFRVDGSCPYVNFKVPHKYNQRFKKTSSRLKFFSKTDIENDNSKTKLCTSS